MDDDPQREVPEAAEREAPEQEGNIPRSVVGESDSTLPVEPGSPSLEHVAFTVLGAAFTIFALSRLFF